MTYLGSGDRRPSSPATTRRGWTTWPTTSPWRARRWTASRRAPRPSGPCWCTSARCMTTRSSTSPARRRERLARGLHRSGPRRAHRQCRPGHPQRRRADPAHRGELPATQLTAALVPPDGREVRRHPLCGVLRSPASPKNGHTDRQHHCGPPPGFRSDNAHYDEHCPPEPPAEPPASRDEPPGPAPASCVTHARLRNP